jgi:protein-S-isoprenylcysteine O-methyltransferase Ste14
MYLGGFAMLLGFALMHRSLAMALLAVGFLGFFHLFVVWYEEPHLGRKFGDAYLDYRRDARRWIPRRPLSR